MALLLLIYVYDNNNKKIQRSLQFVIKKNFLQYTPFTLISVYFVNPVQLNV